MSQRRLAGCLVPLAIPLAAIFLVAMLLLGVASVLQHAIPGFGGPGAPDNVVTVTDPDTANLFPVAAGEEQPSDFAVISDQGKVVIPPEYQIMLPTWTNERSRCGIPYGISAGLAATESNFGRNKNDSSAGAQGDYQFMPTTWYDPTTNRGWGIDPDTHLLGNIRNPRDAGPAADRYLCYLMIRFGKDPQGFPYTWAQAIRRAIFYYGGDQSRAYNPNDDEVVKVMGFARLYSRPGSVAVVNGRCTGKPSIPSDLRASLLADYGILFLEFDATHLQWSWEELCNLSGTRFPTLLRGAQIQASSLSASQQLPGCPGNILLGQFADKNTFQVALTHEGGHAIWHCKVDGTALGIAFSNAHYREGGVSYYARNAFSCTGSDEFNEDNADTTAYYLNPGMRRSMVRCESDHNVFDAPDLRSFPLHLAWAAAVYGSINPNVSASVPVPSL